ncbi:matrix metalloproteinase-26-like [Schistocerca nitens]|uniref:matrix metalloproteinase-26-like n=1 Tax=Schistocerca nitens TaxID=7011 RepID=UPI002117DAFB|nr:matrix metalloproteinase-26-like [Schistocerca nitens]
MYKWNKKNIKWNYKIANKREFNGKGNVLGHAFFPNRNNDPLETQMDKDENWYSEIEKHIPKYQTKIFVVLVHEIGDVLSLENSDDFESIMYPYYNGSHLELSENDNDAIQSIYGTQ